jgi:hypothetical protein
MLRFDCAKRPFYCVGTEANFALQPKPNQNRPWRPSKRCGAISNLGLSCIHVSVTRNSAFQALPVRNPMVPANNLVNEDARETTAVAGGVRWGCPSRVGCKINETSKSASRCTNYQFYLWAHDQQFTVTLTEKFSTSNASIIAKPPESRVHGNSPGFATESERHPSLPCKMRSFRLPGLLFTK